MGQLFRPDGGIVEVAPPKAAAERRQRGLSGCTGRPDSAACRENRRSSVIAVWMGSIFEGIYSREIFTSRGRASCYQERPFQVIFKQFKAILAFSVTFWPSLHFLASPGLPQPPLMSLENLRKMDHACEEQREGEGGGGSIPESKEEPVKAAQEPSREPRGLSTL